MLQRPKNKSLFIVFEGLDGAGTTTQVDLLAGYLRNEMPEQKILVTKEPTNHLIGGLIRGCLTGDWKTSPAGLQLLFAADRAHHLHRQIEPALANGSFVIADRYYLSTIAYGSIDLDEKWLYEINRQFLRPDLTIFLDVSAKTAIERMKKVRYNIELFEREEILEKVRAKYLELAKNEKNIHVINGEESITKVRDDVNKIIKNLTL